MSFSISTPPLPLSPPERDGAHAGSESDAADDSGRGSPGAFSDGPVKHEAGPFPDVFVRLSKDVCDPIEIIPAADGSLESAVPPWLTSGGVVGTGGQVRGGRSGDVGYANIGRGRAYSGRAAATVADARDDPAQRFQPTRGKMSKEEQAQVHERLWERARSELVRKNEHEAQRLQREIEYYGDDSIESEREQQKPSKEEKKAAIALRRGPGTSGVQFSPSWRAESRGVLWVRASQSSSPFKLPHPSQSTSR